MVPSDRKSVTHWVRDLKEGDEEAARQLWERYFDQLVSLARNKLGNAPRRAADEEDVAQSVFKSLCRGAARGRFGQLTDRDDLWRLLLTITKQKTVDQLRHAGRQKRGGGQVRGESVFIRPGADGRQAGIDQFVVEEPTPEFLAQVEEEYQHLLGLLRDDTHRKIALWKMEGYTNEEVAEKLGVSVRSVERKLKIIRQDWSKGSPA